jgi:hypothetical protein
VDDAGVVDAVDAHDVRGNGLRIGLGVADFAERHRIQPKRRARAFEVGLEPGDIDAVSGGDDQHDGEAAAQDRHLGILDVALVLQKHSGHGCDDARPVPPDRGYGEMAHGPHSISRPP